MDVRVKRLHPAAGQLVESGPARERHRIDPGRCEMRRRPARCDDASAVRDQRLRELDGAALVREREQREARPAGLPTHAPIRLLDIRCTHIPFRGAGHAAGPVSLRQASR